MTAPRIAICDYGVGNMRSVERAVAAAGGEPVLSGEPDALERCDALVLPGVGAFGAAVDALRGRGLDRVVSAVAGSGRPLLGVCLGYQLLFEHSTENGGREGLGLLPGRVERLDPGRGKVPHMGWNTLQHRRSAPVVDGVAEGAFVYFVHSYAPVTGGAHVVSTCDYGGVVVAVCALDNVWGTQFHPEKSGASGLRIYGNLVAAAARP